MKLSSTLVICLILGAFTAGLFLISCEEENQSPQFMDFDAEEYAKEKDLDSNCYDNDWFIEDCLDACMCCVWVRGRGDRPDEDEVMEKLEYCVGHCDDSLLRAEDYPPAHVDVDGYKECVVGCFSTCEYLGQPTYCANQCKPFLE